MERDNRPSVASALAVAILEEQVRETGELGIPGLGIKLGPDDLREDLREDFYKRKKERSEREKRRAGGGTMASALAVAILEEQVRETGRLGIPNLGIELTKDDLLKTEPSEPHQEKPKKLGNQG